jgi:Flp pilus assembly pilin Flp
MIRQLRGASMVEYVVLVVLLVGLVGGALLAVSNSINANIQATYNNMNNPDW